MIWGHFDPFHPSPVCNGGGQKWPVLRSKSGHNGRVTQGPWNNIETLERLKSQFYQYENMI